MPDVEMKAKRQMKSKEERIAELNRKIAFHEEKIAALKEKVTTIENSITMKDVATAIKDSGLPLDVVMKAIAELKN